MQGMAKKNPPTPTRRRYSSTLRARQAGETRAQVLAAAAALFEESGWAGTTVAAILSDTEVVLSTPALLSGNADLAFSGAAGGLGMSRGAAASLEQLGRQVRRNH